MNDAWISLRGYTQARIALGRAGHAVPTQALLDFQLAHAQARDAVHFLWNIRTFAEQVHSLGEEVLILDTPVASRSEYLSRPDLGRMLNEESSIRLANIKYDAAEIVMIVTNGLSSTAIERHGIGLLQAIVKAFRSKPFTIAPIILVANGRVALSDEIGSAFAAKLAIMIVGERPGLSAADSLGIYLTYNPRLGNTDAERNCISNIRPPEGMGYADAAAKLLYLSEESIRRGLSGVGLKDDMNDELIEKLDKSEMTD
jgi:ethanolamine ammonia-lyase small subunit